MNKIIGIKIGFIILGIFLLIIEGEKCFSLNYDYVCLSFVCRIFLYIGILILYSKIKRNGDF